MTTVKEYISELKPLLAQDKIDGSRGILFGTASEGGEGIKINSNDQFLMIGLGGTGIKTLDYVKGVLSRRMESGWQRNVRFIGIDADWREIDQAAYLLRQECQTITDSQITEKIQKDSAKWPDTWRHITDEKTIQSLDNKKPHEPGSGRLRILGKLKFHDKEDTASAGYDELIEKRIAAASSAMGGCSGQLYVFVVGSLCGGTCSGCITEMPALIRSALKGKPSKIYPLLFLPDTMTEHPDIPKPDEMEANAFAALKELDYYNGLLMRSGYDGEKWYTNKSAAPVISLPCGTDFMDLPILVGTRNGPGPDSAQIAQETIAEFLISMVGQYSSINGKAFTIQSAFSNTATTMDKRRGLSKGIEEAGHHHNVPRVYGAIGFAESSAPIKTVRAYVVAEVCKASGIRSVSKDDWSKYQNATGMLPFRGKDNLLTVQKGIAQAQLIVQPLEDAIKGIVLNGKCDLVDEETGDARFVYNWQTVKQDELYNNSDFKRYLSDVIRDQTDARAITRMENELKNAYDRFLVNVQNFVMEEGPFAFVNLYHGKFIPSSNIKPIGLKEMLENLYNGKKAQGGDVYIANVASAQQEENTCKDALANAKEGLFATIGNFFTGDKKAQLVNDWMDSVEKHVIARINQIRSETAFGLNNAFYDQFYLRADQLTQDLYCFGQILDDMIDIYDNFGSVVTDEEKFANACDNASELNLAALNHNSYKWIRSQADADIKTANGTAIRKALVSNFFGRDDTGRPNSRLWLEIPDNRILVKEGHTCLSNRDVAIPAREMFDKVVSEVPNTLDVSISALFKKSAPTPSEQTDMANSVIQGLAEKSLPLFHGTYDMDNCIRTLIYPSSLDASIAADLCDAANNIFTANGNSINSYASDDTSSIRILQVVTPLEMYRLTRLADWERVYESKIREGDDIYFHGYAPGTTFTTDDEHNLHTNIKRTWREYPSPVSHIRDPRQTTDLQTGRIIWEGQRQMRIDGVLEAGKELGLLYAVNTGAQIENSWIIRFARLQPNWKLDIERIVCSTKDKTYPTGKALVAEVARQNGNTLDDISIDVQLQHAGIFSIGAKTEKDAWDRARKVFYVHIPMLEQLDESISWLRDRAAAVMEANEKARGRIMCAKFPSILSSGQIFERNNAWLVKTNSGDVQILNMDFQRRKPLYRSMSAAGLTYAYIYRALLNAPELENAAYDAMYLNAESAYEELENDINRNDPVAVEEERQWMARVNPLKAELDGLKDRYKQTFNGAETKPSTLLLRTMQNECKLSDEEIVEITEFYAMVSDWDRWIEE